MNFHIFTIISSSKRLCIELTEWPAPSWLDSSIGRTLHRYRRGHGYESRSSLNFFQAFFSQLLKLRIQLRWSFTYSFENSIEQQMEPIKTRGKAPSWYQKTVSLVFALWFVSNLCLFCFVFSYRAHQRKTQIRGKYRWLGSSIHWWVVR